MQTGHRRGVKSSGRLRSAGEARGDMRGDEGDGAQRSGRGLQRAGSKVAVAIRRTFNKPSKEEDGQLPPKVVQYTLLLRIVS